LNVLPIKRFKQIIARQNDKENGKIQTEKIEGETV